mgnify:CR=1 FL=1
MKPLTIAWFGEAEKGVYHTPTIINTLDQLNYFFGEPPKDSKGLILAVQTLLYNYSLIFLRVQEEGYSITDYYEGFKAIASREDIGAIGIPGMGDKAVIEVILPQFTFNKQIVIVTEQDLYDYLTFNKATIS